MKLDYSSAFLRAYKKRIKGNKNLEERFAEHLEKFIANPSDPSLKVHKLIQGMEGLLAFKVDYDCRVVFEYIEPDVVLFIDIGTHDQVY